MFGFMVLEIPIQWLWASGKSSMHVRVNHLHHKPGHKKQESTGWSPIDPEDLPLVSTFEGPTTLSNTAILVTNTFWLL